MRSGVGGLVGTGQMSSTGGHSWEIFICDITQKKNIKIINCILTECDSIYHGQTE